MKRKHLLAALLLAFSIAPIAVQASPVAVTDFSLRVFQESLSDEENTLISPLSVLYALSMTANGAKDNTLMQMEEVLGLDTTEWNTYLSAYKKTLSSETLNIANSIWVNEEERFTVEPDFLQINTEYYDAGIFSEIFDEAALSKINQWVSEETSGKIDRILEEIPEDAVMYLINALAFEGKWEEPYEEAQLHEGIFNLEDGTEQIVDFMYAEENSYLEGENATGFLKYYKDGKYAFAAILPNEGVSLKDYISALDGETLYEMVHSVQDADVKTETPQFVASYEIEMNEMFKELGMTDAFDPALADFSGLGHSDNGNIYIGKILHKTYLSLDAQGTEASGVTAVEMIAECALEIVEEPKYVYLDRPFMYMIMDCEEGIPIFMGTVLNVPAFE